MSPEKAILSYTFLLISIKKQQSASFHTGKNILDYNTNRGKPFRLNLNLKPPLFLVSKAKKKAVKTGLLWAKHSLCKSKREEKRSLWPQAERGTSASPQRRFDSKSLQQKDTLMFKTLFDLPPIDAGRSATRETFLRSPSSSSLSTRLYLWFCARSTRLSITRRLTCSRRSSWWTTTAMTVSTRSTRHESLCRSLHKKKMKGANHSQIYPNFSLPHIYDNWVKTLLLFFGHTSCWTSCH